MIHPEYPNHSETDYKKINKWNDNIAKQYITKIIFTMVSGSQVTAYKPGLIHAYEVGTHWLGQNRHNKPEEYVHKDDYVYLSLGTSELASEICLKVSDIVSFETQYEKVNAIFEKLGDESEEILS